MIKLALVVGHERDRPGARAVSPIDANEYAWNRDLAMMMADHVNAMDGPQAEIFFCDEAGILGAYNAVKRWGADAAIELHFNAAGPTATGTETLYLTGASRPLAEVVHTATLATLGLRDRGVKTPQRASGGRGEFNLSQMGCKPSILTEPFFGSNADDAATAQRLKRELAIAQADAAIAILRSR